MEKAKSLGMFALKVLAVLFIVRLVKPMAPEAIQKYLP